MQHAHEFIGYYGYMITIINIPRIVYWLFYKNKLKNKYKKDIFRNIIQNKVITAEIISLYLYKNDMILRDIEFHITIIYKHFLHQKCLVGIILFSSNPFHIKFLL